MDVSTGSQPRVYRQTARAKASAGGSERAADVVDELLAAPAPGDVPEPDPTVSVAAAPAS